MPKKNTLKLGDKVKDIITGFTGIAVAKTEWIHGCDRITVQPTVKKDGKLPENMTFDEPSLVIVKAGFAKPKVKSKTGGVQNDKAALRRN